MLCPLRFIALSDKINAEGAEHRRDHAEILQMKTRAVLPILCFLCLFVATLYEQA
jgi:hypothetical protein